MKCYVVLFGGVAFFWVKDYLEKVSSGIIEKWDVYKIDSVNC